MKNNKIIQFAQALILLPIMSVSGSVGNLSESYTDIDKVSPTVFLQKQNNKAFNLFAFNQAIDEEAQIRQLKADAIDAYFQERGMPLAGFGMKMVLEAEKNNLDWRLLPAIAVRESTGGKFECKKVKNSPFGWGSCKINFSSNEEAIETVALNLGGNNPNTARYYENKTTEQILRAYNPPHIVRRYAQQVISIMNTIGDLEVTLPSAT
jgi:hypothetical protein